MKCSRCKNPAVTYVRYSGQHLCIEHFIDFFETRVFKEFRKQVDLSRIDRVGVAVSGGKDSIVALRMIHKIIGERRDCDMFGITIDEGIEDYRASSVDIAVEEYEKLGVDYEIRSFYDSFGKTLDEMVEKEDSKKPCSVCGVLRRWLMNKMAKDAGADVLATGLNLDDTSQSLLMNFCRGDMEKMARLGPHEIIKEGLVPRIAPLRRTPENEAYLYALVNGMKIHEKECPYAVFALRGLYRDVLGQLEDNTPGTKFAILSSYEKIKRELTEKYGGGELESCVECGEATIEGVCKTCEMLKNLGLEV
ncbi:MAG: TIGR00269 family protein [Candidatus Saliniplasma sp.]